MLHVPDAVSAPSVYVCVRECRYWGNLGHALRIKTPNAMVRASELGFNSFGSILMIPDAHHWMSSMVVSNVTVENCSITCGDPWATAQYDVDPAGVAVTACVDRRWVRRPQSIHPSIITWLFIDSPIDRVYARCVMPVTI